MEVIRHHLKSQHLHFRMAAGNLAPAAHHFLSEGREMHVRSIAMLRRQARVSQHLPQQRTPALHGQCQHVDMAAVVVVEVAAALHRRLPSVGVLAFGSDSSLVHEEKKAGRFRQTSPLRSRFRGRLLPVGRVDLYEG